tara:strand:+ start:73085 stop:74068 length:984 start_codon:yes stop_codon:yes gene_type:complete
MLSHDFIFKSDQSFDERCLKIFRYQAAKSAVFRTYIEAFGLSEHSDIKVDDIPLLPIEAFKYKPIIIDELESELLFKSSGTGNMKRSVHYVHNKEIYKNAITEEFYRHFPLSDYSTLFYMPGYDKNKHSSLIWMADHLIQCDKSGLSRYLPGEKKEIQEHIEKVQNENKTVVLFAAAFGILDLIDSNLIHSPKSMQVIETGGMKTYRRELSKYDLREKISSEFGIPQDQIHSEYGMCELLSQSYAIGSEWFQAPHWVKITIRKDENPREICEIGEEGKIGIIDLANLHSCPFILTEDRGVLGKNNTFQVLGRWNPENMRGCNFLIDS